MSRKKRNGCMGCLMCILGIMSLIVGLCCVGIFIFRRMPSGSEAVQEAVQEFREKDIPFQELEVAEKSVKDGFYYEQLGTEEEKLIYKEILQGVMDGSEDIYIHADNGYQTNDIFFDVLNDHPEIFWCTGTATSNSYSESFTQEAYVILKPEYIYSGEELQQKVEEVEAAAEKCLSLAASRASDYEKIKSVYEYLINTVDYNWDAPNNQNIYSALVGRESVCAGYARSTQYLLRRLGIECAYVTGKAANQEGTVEDHAWNIVLCDGEWYFVDTTWGDPIFRQEESSVQLAATYDYLCCSENELFRTHTLTEGYEYPSCQSETYNYYMLNGMYYDSFDKDRMKQAVYDSIDREEAVTVFKFSDENVYNEAHDWVIGELVEQGTSYIARKYWLGTVHYSYEENAFLNKITLYWNYE